MTEGSLSSQDFPNICRICLNTADHLQNFVHSKMTSLYKLLTNIEIKDDDFFPKNVCGLCKKYLDDINLFIEKCKNSDLLLKNIYLEEENVTDSDNCVFDQNAGSLNKPPIRAKKKDNLKNTTLNTKIIPAEVKTAIEQKCHSCGKYINQEDVQEHYRLSPMCKPSDCTCPVCGKLFYPTKKLKIHLKSHKKETIYECPECSKRFTFAENLRRHAFTHSAVKPFTCEICNKGFLRKRSLDEHMNFHTGRTPYICVYCGEGFRRMTDHHGHVYRNHSDNIEKVPIHKRKYTEKRVHLKLECEKCGKIFASRSGFDNHQLNHKGVKRFLCNVCGRKFITNATLQNHIRTHTGEKPFECNKCGKVFSQKNALNVHMSRHVTDESLNCPHCDQKCNTKSGLNNHLLSHSNSKLECPECKKLFRKENTLRNHILQHSADKPHRCNLCNKSFIAPSHLNTHLRIHSGEKPYRCSVCGKHLGHPQTLKVHMRLHTGETPFICSVCEKGFHDVSNFKRHFSRHHSGGNVPIKSDVKK